MIKISSLYLTIYVKKHATTVVNDQESCDDYANRAKGRVQNEESAKSMQLTHSAIKVSTSGDNITQQRNRAHRRNNVYIMRVLVDCFTAGKQLQHKLHVSAQQQHVTCINTNTFIQSTMNQNK